MKHLHKLVILLVVFLGACQPAVIPIPSVTAIFTEQPAMETAMAIAPITPTSTEFPLRYDPNITGESEYCNLAQVNLLKTETEGLSIEEVTQKLMELWLEHYLAPDAPLFCIIQQYQIDRIYYDERIANLPLEPKGDYVYVVDFSVMLTHVPNSWMSYPGYVDQDGWLHTSQVVAIFETDEEFVMRFAHP